MGTEDRFGDLPSGPREGGSAPDGSMGGSGGGPGSISGNSTDPTIPLYKESGVPTDPTSPLYNESGTPTDPLAPIGLNPQPLPPGGASGMGDGSIRSGETDPGPIQRSAGASDPGPMSRGVLGAIIVVCILALLGGISYAILSGLGGHGLGIFAASSGQDATPTLPPGCVYAISSSSSSHSTTVICTPTVVSTPTLPPGCVYAVSSSSSSSVVVLCMPTAGPPTAPPVGVAHPTPTNPPSAVPTATPVAPPPTPTPKPAPPRLSVSPTQVSENCAGQWPNTITVKNSGSGTLTWQGSTVAGVHLTPASGSLGAGQATQVTLSGQWGASFAVNFASNGGGASVTVNCT